VPFSMVEQQNYYTVNASNELVLNVFSKTANMNGSIVIGKAPSILKQGTRYYSWDGNKFYTNSTGLSTSYVGQSYSYFQYLPARVQTSYTAAELNQYINKRLSDLEKTGLSKYKDASKRSKIIGLGTY
ncbi:endo-beta-N-acetylglucosaminidase, partial [Bacillus cereus]